MAPSSFPLESVLMKSQRELSKTVAKGICAIHTLAAENLVRPKTVRSECKF